MPRLLLNRLAGPYNLDGPNNTCMSITGIHSSMPAWLTGLLFLAGMMMAAELGCRAASWRARGERGGSSELGTIQGGVLGILGLLLGFTYAFVAARAESRKTCILEEANAIGSAYLRAGLVAEPIRSELRAAFREYVSSRLVSDDTFLDPAKAVDVIARSEKAQAKLWPLGTRALEGHAPNAVDSLLLQSINEVIDLHSRRLAAARDHLPPIILVMLFFVSVVSMGLSGFASGAAGRRNFFFTTTLAILVSVVVMIVLDMDNPRGGFIRINQQALIDLEQSLRHDAEATSPDAAAGHGGGKATGGSRE